MHRMIFLCGFPTVRVIKTACQLDVRYHIMAMFSGLEVSCDASLAWQVRCGYENHVIFN